MNDANSTSGVSHSLNDAVQEHVNSCSQCSKLIKSLRPIGLGATSPLCSEYWRIIREWSDTEGYVNNIVAHDEYGNEAPRAGDPENVRRP
jgi:hypothetical protein